MQKRRAHGTGAPHEEGKRSANTDETGEQPFHTNLPAGALNTESGQLHDRIKEEKNGGYFYTQRDCENLGER